jgi:hypothetical protein
MNGVIVGLSRIMFEFLAVARDFSFLESNHQWIFRALFRGTKLPWVHADLMLNWNYCSISPTYFQRCGKGKYHYNFTTVIYGVSRWVREEIFQTVSTRGLQE